MHTKTWDGVRELVGLSYRLLNVDGSCSGFWGLKLGGNFSQEWQGTGRERGDSETFPPPLKFQIAWVCRSTVYHLTVYHIVYHHTLCSIEEMLPARSPAWPYNHIYLDTSKHLRINYRNSSSVQSETG